MFWYCYFLYSFWKIDSAGNSSDDIMSATDDLLREADILMAEIAEFRRENSSK